MRSQCCNVAARAALAESAPLGLGRLKEECAQAVSRRFTRLSFRGSRHGRGGRPRGVKLSRTGFDGGVDRETRPGSARPMGRPETTQRTRHNPLTSVDQLEGSDLDA
jgi:hypothetical protein